MSARMEYQAVAYIAFRGCLIDYKSGWWESEDKARAELDGMLERALPAGLYNMSVNLNTRRSEL